MRFDAPEPFVGNFVEYSTKWTVGQRRDVFEVKGDEYLALMRSKITALHIDCEGGKPITQASDLVQGRYDNVDSVLWDWFAVTPLAALREVVRLGEAMRSQLFDPPAKTASDTTPTPL